MTAPRSAIRSVSFMCGVLMSACGRARNPGRSVVIVVCSYAGSGLLWPSRARGTAEPSLRGSVGLLDRAHPAGGEDARSKLLIGVIDTCRLDVLGLRGLPFGVVAVAHAVPRLAAALAAPMRA